MLTPGERAGWLYEWLVTYPPSMRVRKTNFPYTRAQAEAKFGARWCEPVLEPGTMGGGHVMRPAPGHDSHTAMTAAMKKAP